MLRIPDQFLDCSLYIYESMETAESGMPSGGSGFLVAVPLLANPQESQLYVVTNRHVVANVDHPVLRLNSVTGVAHSLETNSLRWVNSHEDDLAVLPLDIAEEDYKLACVPVKAFMTEDKSKGLGIGPGDEVFMVGRFISHEGKQKNTPTVRFGNISMMAHEPMENAFGQLQETFLVECRSIPGYSGSPVFMFIDLTLPRPPNWFTPAMPVYNPEAHGPWFLGIDWCHIYNYESVLKENKEAPLVPKQWVRSNTGMAGVIPAWRLQSLLNTEGLVAQRKERDERITAERKA
jgi:hypothetical protein